jgi:hypothetical protein
MTYLAHAFEFLDLPLYVCSYSALLIPGLTIAGRFYLDIRYTSYQEFQPIARFQAHVILCNTLLTTSFRSQTFFTYIHGI